MSNITPESAQNAPIFSVQRLYLKDASFEAPALPKAFQMAIQPQVELDLKIDHQALDDHMFEVSLSVTTTAKNAEQTVFIAEIKYAGIFKIQHVTDEQSHYLLNVACPTVLFPYVREALTSLTTRATLPPLFLDPVNFEALYQQQHAAPATIQ